MRLAGDPAASTPSRLRQYAEGAWAIMPLLPGIVPFGVIAGVAAAEAGFDSAAGIGQSLIVFAGAAQLATVQLLSDGAVPVVIILTGLTINLRFAMYSASLAPHLVGLAWWQRILVAYFMTDQVYVLSVVRFAPHPELSIARRMRYYLGAGIIIWLIWQGSTIAGYSLGSRVPPEWSLDFFLPLSFLALIVPGLRDRPTVVAAVVAGTVAFAGRGLPFNLGLFVGALLGIVAGYVAESRQATARDGAGA